MAKPEFFDSDPTIIANAKELERETKKLPPTIEEDGADSRVQTIGLEMMNQYQSNHVNKEEAVSRSDHEVLDSLLCKVCSSDLQDQRSAATGLSLSTRKGTEVRALLGEFAVDREPWPQQTIHLSGQANRLGEQISKSILVRMSHFWPIIDHANNNLRTAFMCFDLKGQSLEGRLLLKATTENLKLISAGDIYHLTKYIVVPNKSQYKLTPRRYFIHINHATSGVKLEDTIPDFPSHSFSPHSISQLLQSATSTTYLPDVVGQIRIMQGINYDYPDSKTKLIIGLLLDRSTMVKLTLWDNQASLFRRLQSISNRKYQVVIVTSVIPSLSKGKLLLSSSSATQLHFDNSIKLIREFKGRIRSNINM